MSTPDPTAGERCPTCGLFREEPDEPIQPGDYYTVDPTSPTRCPSCGLVPSRGSEGAARVAQARHSTSPPAVAASTGTSEDVDLREVIRLAAEKYLSDFDTVMNVRSEARDLAVMIDRAVLASDWLAAREAAARAEALREAADAFGHMWQADAIPSASIVYRALRDRADRIAREVRP